MIFVAARTKELEITTPVIAIRINVDSQSINLNSSLDDR